MREGKTAYFYRHIKAENEIRAVLSISTSGAAAAWLDGKPLHRNHLTQPPLTADSEEGAFHVPGQNAILYPLSIKRGAHHLLIRCDAPADGAGWMFSSKFIDPVELRNGKTKNYPSWQLLSTRQGLGIRLGDPEIEKYLGREQTVTITSDNFTTVTKSVKLGETAGFIEWDNLKNNTLCKTDAQTENLHILADNKLSDWERLDIGGHRLAVLNGKRRSDNEAIGKWQSLDKDQWGYILYDTATKQNPESKANALIVVAGWPKSNAWSLTASSAQLRKAAQLRNTAVVLAPWGSIEETSTMEKRLKQIIQDAGKKLGLKDDARIIACGHGQSAALLLEGSLEGRIPWDGLILIEPDWDIAANWMELLHMLAPRPDVAILGPRKAHDAIADAEVDLETAQGTWLRLHANEKQNIDKAVESTVHSDATLSTPERVVIGGHLATQSLKRHWLAVEKAIDWHEPVFLSCDMLEANRFEIEASNIETFAMQLSAFKNINHQKPVVLSIDQQGQRQRLSIVGPQIPQWVTITLRRKNEKENPIWQAATGRNHSNDKPRQICNLKSPTPPLANTETGGMVQFFGLAALEIGGGNIALTPARAMRSGQDGGAVYPHDAVSMATDDSLTTVSMNWAESLKAIEREYAGRRRWVTTGLNARLSGGPDIILDSNVRLPVTPIAQPGIFLFDNQKDDQTKIDIIGWTSELQNLQKKNNAEPGHQYDRLGQREALLRYFNKHYLIDPPELDIHNQKSIYARQHKWILRP